MGSIIAGKRTQRGKPQGEKFPFASIRDLLGTFP
jgi:hypothetical protein